jgi:hypothetical protein
MDNPYAYTHGENSSSNRPLVDFQSLVDLLPGELDPSKVLASDLRIACGKQNVLEWKFGSADMWAGPDWGPIGTVSDENIQALSAIGIEVIR